MSYESKLQQAEYWELLATREETYTIQYTSYGSGWVRCKLCDLTPFEYAVCKNFIHAEHIGKNMLILQRKRRE